MYSLSGIKKIACIGNYLPRQCGIATFTTSLCESIAAHSPELQCFSVPVTDIDEGYDYPERVRFEIKERDMSSYERAAEFLNVNNVDIACVQHEFGIYGGSAGSYALILLRMLNMPVVTTLHTLLMEPSEQQRRVMERLAALSDRLVVMTKKGVEILKEVYSVDPLKIIQIPHGILDVPFVDPNFFKDLFGVEGKLVLLTFGLLSPDKGIEFVLEALPQIIEKHPDVVYIILGATHPNLLKHEGENYRLKLHYMVENLGLEKNVFFYNRFVSTDELTEFIGAADIYITPYLKETQITSGTLAYSFGAGKAVISTPYWHARELLDGNRGILVPMSDSGAIAREVISLIENEAQRHAMRKNAYLTSREMIWSNVAYRYLQAFEDARIKRLRIQQRSPSRTLQTRYRELPKIKLDQLFRLSDNFGIYRHAIHTIPDYHGGYTTDENSMALVLAVLMEDAADGISAKLDDIAAISLAFLNYSFDKNTNRFHFLMNFDRRWSDQFGSETAHSRILWALGTCIGRTKNKDLQTICGHLFEKALSVSFEFQDLHSWAYTLIGIHEYLRRFDGDRFVDHGRELLAGKLFDTYTTMKRPGSPWFEQGISHSNALLPHAMILSGRWMKNTTMLNAGLDSLRWLAGIQTSPKNCFHPFTTPDIETITPAIFNNNDHPQQPPETQNMVSACLEAYRTTQDPFWFSEARKVFDWFLGRNDLGVPLYDSRTGGCRDALHLDRVNQNQGALASLSFYQSLVEMQEMENLIESFKQPITT